MNIPTKEECMDILSKNQTPENIIKHTSRVCEVAERVADKLSEKGVSVNKALAVAGALLHDVEKLKENHNLAGGVLLRKLGYPEVASAIERHSLYHIDDEEVQPRTVEEKIVFYADKRVRGVEVVSVQERFEDLKKRYNITHMEKEYAYTMKIEKELLGEDTDLGF